MTDPSASSPVAAIPVLLLKTASVPTDAYHQLLSSSAPITDLATGPGPGPQFVPRFLPVFLHRFRPEATSWLEELLRQRRIGDGHDCTFGGLVFTSQRAVDAFRSVLDSLLLSGKQEAPLIGQQTPVYSVGPATARAIRSLPLAQPLQVFGEHTGNGEALARFILEHYPQWYPHRPARPSLLFLVGEQRSDLLTKTLTDPSLPPKARISIREEVVYDTTILPSFPSDLETALEETESASHRWVVVFSPAGCDVLLRQLGFLDSVTGKARPEKRDGRTLIATIGPTTRHHFVNGFGLEPDVCAASPTPEGLFRALVDFKATSRKL